MQRRRTLSGSSGVTIRSLGNTQPSLFPSGRVAIQPVSRSKISDPTPTSRVSSILVGLISPLYQDLSTRIAPCCSRSLFFNPYASDSRHPQNVTRSNASPSLSSRTVHARRYSASVTRCRRERSDRLAVLGVFRPEAMLDV